MSHQFLITHSKGVGNFLRKGTSKTGSIPALAWAYFQQIFDFLFLHVREKLGSQQQTHSYIMDNVMYDSHSLVPSPIRVKFGGEKNLITSTVEPLYKGQVGDRARGCPLLGG